ncbi:MAG: uracil-DNA glycosylase [Chloroflexia bacterium]|nr:uracil-DNA glycosylase [Chloroflexia bacterium]
MTQPGLFDDQPFASLDAVRREALECRRCDLWKSGHRVVFGSGAERARLMVVGEGPSDADDRTGLPFSGPSGGLLDAWLGELALSRAEVWLTNVVKHRPTMTEHGRERNRPPRAKEAAACAVWLAEELRHVRPDLVLALGGSAGKALIGRDFKITQQRGVMLAGPGDVPVLATFHPAYLLRLEPPELQEAVRLVREDLALVRQTIAVP